MAVINQSKVIDNLNKYLDWHNLPVRMNKSGICNGLATVYAKYVLEGREDEFRRILHRIGTMTTETELDSEINHFATEIVLSFHPELFNKESNQLKSLETLQIDGKSLKSSFELGLVTSDKNWSTILKDLALRDDEAMVVRSLNHTITINKKNGKYVVYDPNYKYGFKTFSNEKDLVHELHHNVFYYSGQLGRITDQLGISQELSMVTGPLGLNGPLGMSIQVVRHPARENSSRKFPEIKDLYKKYLDPNQTAITRWGSIDNLKLAIIQDDNDALDELYAKGLKDKAPIDSACMAVSLNSTKVLGNLLTKIPEKDEVNLAGLFKVALASGHRESFDELLKNNKCNKCFNEQVILTQNAGDFIKLAAAGNNVELLQHIIETYQRNGKPQPFSDTELVKTILQDTQPPLLPQPEGLLPCPKADGDTIQVAINNGSIDCVKLLLKQVNKDDYKLQEKQLLTYLLQAVKTNQPHMVDFFVNEIKTNIPEDNQKNMFKSISMNINSVERTDLSILRQLKTCGVPFSKNAESVIDQKENRPIGFLLPIGIMLNKFTDFIKENLFKNDDVKHSIEKFQKFKSKATQECKSITTEVEQTVDNKSITQAEIEF